MRCDAVQTMACPHKYMRGGASVAFFWLLLVILGSCVVSFSLSVLPSRTHHTEQQKQQQQFGSSSPRTRPRRHLGHSPPTCLIMVQSLNLQGILAVGQVLRNPSLMLPHVSIKHIGLLDFELLRQAGIKGIIFDKDNTLTAPYIDSVHPQVAAAFENSKRVFGAKKLIIISNSAGTLDDANYEAATRIEAKLGVPVLRHAIKKPGAIPEVLEHFKRECGPETTYENLCIIGDRLLTDVMWGNFAGMFTVHTQILTPVGDNKVAAIVRRLENVACRLLSPHWPAMPHPALASRVVFAEAGEEEGGGGEAKKEL